jgi:hypothetical protein
MTSVPPDTAPPKPVLALTLALAGKRQIKNGANGMLDEGLRLAFDAIAARLGALADMSGRKGDPLAARFIAGANARLTLVTGLADGADQIAADLFVAGDQPDSVTRVFGAVLPCGRDAYVANSAVTDTARFARQWEACAFVIELDSPLPPSPAPSGSQDAPSKADLEASRERADAFSGQSELLLRHADILVAVDDPNDNGRAGGTRDTIHGAFDIGVPVILLRLGEPGLAVLRTRGDLEEPVMLPPGAAHESLADLVDDLIGVAASTRDADYVAALYEEFFAPRVCHTGRLNRVWDWFEAGFKLEKGPFQYHLDRLLRRAGEPDIEETARFQEPPLETVYGPYKERASALSAYYGGQYRGAFLAGYGLAIVAVFAAILSLALLPNAVMEPGGPIVWPVVIIGLALVKIVVVFGIFRLAERANSKALAHRAADYRYISERLRAMTYLPKVGSLRPPAPWSLPYTTRVAAQGVMDRLFVSIIRQAEPLATLEGRIGDKVVRPDAARAMKSIRDSWISGQIDYHGANYRKLKSLGGWLEYLGRGLNKLVILVALVDLALLVVEVSGVLPRGAGPVVHYWVEPTLVGLAAVLPAAVASINGVRFQSECTRLADRSLQMAGELSNLERRSWRAGARRLRLIDALHLANDAARLTLDEVAEWSAIYGKEFVEM